MTAGERLRALAGFSGPAGMLLKSLGSGSSAGQILVDYSALAGVSAATHLLVERVTVPAIPSARPGGGARPLSRQEQLRRLRRIRRRQDDVLVLLGVV